MILSFAVISTVALLTYAYVVPYLLSGGINEVVNRSSDVLTDGFESVNNAMDGRLKSTTEQILGNTPPETLPETSPASNVTAKVIRVIDGDTLVIGDRTIRLALVNTPERGESGYIEATEFTRNECVVGSTASYRVDSGQPDGSYGRIIAKVWCNSNGLEPSLNELLVDKGHAEIFTNFCKTSEFGKDQWATACR